MIVLRAESAETGAQVLVVGFDDDDARQLLNGEAVSIGWDDLAAAGPFERVTFVHRATSERVVGWVAGDES